MIKYKKTSIFIIYGRFRKGAYLSDQEVFLLSKECHLMIKELRIVPLNGNLGVV